MFQHKTCQNRVSIPNSTSLVAKIQFFSSRPHRTTEKITPSGTPRLRPYDIIPGLRDYRTEHYRRNGVAFISRPQIRLSEFCSAPPSSSSQDSQRPMGLRPFKRRQTSPGTDSIQTKNDLTFFLPETASTSCTSQISTYICKGIRTIP